MSGPGQELVTRAQRFSELPARLRGLIVFQALAAAAAAGAYWRLPQGGEWSLFLCLAVLGLAAGALKIELAARWGRLTMAFAVTYFTLLALGPCAAMAVNVLAAVGAACFNQREGGRRLDLRAVGSYRLVFNAGNYVLAVAAAEAALAALGGRAPDASLGQLVLPIFASSFAYYLVNTWGVAAAIGWTQGRPVVQVWRENFAWAGAGYLATACGVVGAHYLYRQLPMGPAALFLLPPAYLVFQSYRVHVAKIRADVEHMQSVNSLNQSIITSLATAIDAKDRTTHRHIHRVREYAIALGEELKVGEAELEALKIAALLHDIGKLGIPESILCKPGKLSPEEFAVIQEHVQIGARILEPVHFPWPVIPIVLTHHERWDGLGYPRGLKGAEIPIGGRILSLADVYDALTSDRPYRKAMAHEAALEMLAGNAGSQFDPGVVAAFERAYAVAEARIRGLETEADETPAGPKLRARERAGAASSGLPAPTSALPAFSGSETSPADIAKWLCAATTAALPASTVCVYLVEAGGGLRVARAEGLMAERWRDLRVTAGEGAAGYAVERNETLVNVSASLDVARRMRPGENIELSSALVAPLVWEDRPLGALAVYHTGYEIFDGAHAAEARRLASIAAPLLGAVVSGQWSVASTRPTELTTGH